MTADIRQQFHNLLREESQAGKKVVIVMDEAQNLTNPVLEKLRMLSNFESRTHKLLPGCACRSATTCNQTYAS